MLNTLESRVGAALLALLALSERDVPLAPIDLIFKKRAEVRWRCEVGHVGEQASSGYSILKHRQGQ
jgi:hypothetical protein